MMTMRQDLKCRNTKRGCIGMDVLLKMGPRISRRLACLHGLDARLWLRSIATAMLLACMRAPSSRIRRHPFAIT